MNTILLLLGLAMAAETLPSGAATDLGYTPPTLTEHGWRAGLPDGGLDNVQMVASRIAPLASQVLSGGVWAKMERASPLPSVERVQQNAESVRWLTEHGEGTVDDLGNNVAIDRLAQRIR